jgi:glutathione S-transferase
MTSPLKKDSTMPAQDSSARFLLHGHPTSMATYKVALMLRLCGEAFDWCEVDSVSPAFRRGERSEELLRVSRFGQIPALTDRWNGLDLVQSNVMLTYLAEEMGAFLPADRAGRLRVQEWLSFEAGRLFEGVSGVRFLSRFSPDAAEVIAHYRNHASRQLGLLAAALEQEDWLAGREATIADIALYALTSYAPDIAIDLSEDFPAIAAWHCRVQGLDGFGTAAQLLAGAG